ncbi:hypothetical protein [Robiginitalea biformata]|uniref:Uncharacterized protein n=1 Tax=Robiginitalea biformata (strain ATCC BAA-864 / DSM 15991 / KCTC 12146 / HTCC2501) TaxID=313596 RepID=A4CKT9_ROBBH|nr:hypothetical protein [Robiginitalea biformata]EAR15488.1 hypothetical protein RB2501_14209 [Robiginitalea biformata HTCC2501]
MKAYSIFAAFCCLLVLMGCSSDSGDTAPESSDPYFNFTIVDQSGKATFTGSSIHFNSNFTDVKNGEGEDTVLNTIVVVAQDTEGKETLTLGITMEEEVTTGTYKVGTDLFSFFHAFVNYSRNIQEDQLGSQSDDGTFTISSISGSVIRGSINIDASGSAGDLLITGEFVATGI